MDFCWPGGGEWVWEDREGCGKSGERDEWALGSDVEYEEM